MNDPGLDEPISTEARGVENQQYSEDDVAEEDQQAFLKPSLWWFASTAFPLAAGTFGPMASAFSICALAVHWRAYIPPGAQLADGIEIPDPKWLVSINALQLVIALVSNMSLLLNMARRLRFSIAQPITIIGWYISSFALMALCICAKGPLIIEPRKDHAFTQAFYYAIFAAGLYFLVASLMLVTAWGAYRGHYDKEFQLTMSQRTLMLQTIIFLVYLLAGAAVYCHVENWKYLDAVYFVDFTLLTVGIGDYSPLTHLGRGLLFPFAIGGIIILGLVIGSIRSLVLERGKVKLGARMVEKQRRRMIAKLQKKQQDDLLKPITGQKEKGPATAGTSTSGFKDPDLLTERQRRHQEFQMMRKIQADAAQKRRWTSLGISGTTWMALWFVGAAIFYECEKPQQWSYFVSLYFSYTSLLTIGYGDYSPTSNSGKAFFVFWSLLAIPSLTILISNMGDTIVKAIRDLTLKIGDFTVLPGEQGIKTSLKESAHRITRGKFLSSSEDIEEQAPGFLGETKRRTSESDDETGEESGHTHARKNDPESAAQHASSNQAHREESNAKRKANDEIPKDKHHYHCLLIQEISNVMKHLKSSPPRRYTFDEWAYYLMLVGEDENDANKHRKAIKKPTTLGDGVKGGRTNRNEEGDVEWSWLGNRSPLMGNKEEAEWVLERLTNKLKRELKGIRREKVHFAESEGSSAAAQKEEAQSVKD